jgi:hypothetical protein
VDDSNISFVASKLSSLYDPIALITVSWAMLAISSIMVLNLFNPKSINRVKAFLTK